MARRRYQEGNLFTRGKRRKVWALRWWEDSLRPDGTLRRIRRSEVLGTLREIPRRREALKLAQDRLRPLNEGRHRPQSTITFAVFVREHFEPGVLPTLKWGTQQSYSVLLKKHLLPRFGDCRLADVTRAEVQRFVLDKLKQGYSWEHANKCRNLLSKVLGIALSWGYLNDNPVRGVKLPERTSKRPRTFLAADEVRRLLSVLKEPTRTIALLGVFTGLRIAEILGLRWGRLDLGAGVLQVEEICYKGRFGTPKSTASRRQLPLPSAVVRALTVHHARSRDTRPEALVFCTRLASPLSADNLRKRQLRQACKDAGIRPIGWHTLRHTHSSLLHALGVPLKVTQAQLGHSRLSTTLEIYTHAATDDQRSAVAKLEGILDPNGPKFGLSEEPQNEEVLSVQ